MTDAATPISPDMTEELEVESHAPYMRVWAVLAVMTGLEYFYALIFKDHMLLLVLGLVSMALFKACLVGWYFMHLKFEKAWVYILIIPACIMAALLTLALYPDMAMKPVEDAEEAAEEAWVLPSSDAFGPQAPRVRLVAANEVRSIG
jgi:cytochrome c oxidase subunit 4